MDNSPKRKKKISDYIIGEEPFANGAYSTIFITEKLSDPDQKFIAKCVKMSNLPKIANINLEKENAELYRQTKVTTIFDNLISTSNNIYIIYFHYDSNSLYTLVRFQDQNLPLDKKCQIAEMIAQGIRTLHSFKIMHRNLDCSHILVSKNMNEIKFCGLSSLFDFSKGFPKDQIVNENLSAPEMIKSSNEKSTYNEKVDIYSFGCILYFLFTGNYFKNDMNSNVINFLSNVSENFKELMKQCLNKDPSKRPTAEHIIEYKLLSLNEVKKPSIMNPIPNSSNEVEKDDNKIETRNDILPYKRTERVFGEGKFAKVYEVINIKNNKRYALKEIKMEQIFFNKKANELVYGEINLLNQLKELSFVTKLIEFFHYNKKLCMILELCIGGNLEEYVNLLNKNYNKLREDEIKIVAWNLAEGMYHLHQKKIVHRDLKPLNILIVKGNDGSIIDAKICDLGLSRKLKDEDCIYSDCGTPIYMAPEVVQKKKGKEIFYTSKIDIFSYGLILFYLIYQKHAYCLPENDPETGEIVFKPIKENVSTEYLDLMKLCLEPNPGKRINFKKIIQHPFFDIFRIVLAPLKQTYELEKEPTYYGNLTKGYIDLTSKYWITKYSEESIKNPLIKRRVYREIDFLQKSKAIPHSAVMVDYGLIGQSISIVFELCDGLSLQNIFITRKNSGKSSIFELGEIKCVSSIKSPIFELNEIKCVARNAIQFLDAMHGKNFLHRNINLSHIIAKLDDKDKIQDIKVCGFSYTKSEELDSTASLVVTNEAQYFMDPLYIEQGLSEESDLWSLGIVIYFMAFEDFPSKVISELKTIRKTGKLLFQNKIDPNIEEFILYCIKKRNPGDLSQKLLAEDLLKKNIIL